MRFRAKLVHVVVAGLPAAGCTKTEADPKPTPKTETKSTDTKADPKEAKNDPKPDPTPPIVIETDDDIPVKMGGVAMPYNPPPPEPPGKTEPKHLAPPAAEAPAAAAAPAAPSAVGAAATPTTGPTALALAHDHPPGEPCKPLTREEVEKALADLKK